MEIGDKVIVYDQEFTDGKAYANNDRLGIVNTVGADGAPTSIIVFDGDRPRSILVKEFDPNFPYYYPTNTFYREGGDPPDFGKTFGYPQDREWGALIAKQRQEVETQGQSDKVLDRHRNERKELMNKLSQKYPEASDA